MNVRKRSGKVVPFDANFISRAISLASAAAGEHDEEEIAHITQAVTEKLKARLKPSRILPPALAYATCATVWR